MTTRMTQGGRQEGLLHDDDGDEDDDEDYQDELLSYDKGLSAWAEIDLAGRVDYQDHVNDVGKDSDGEDDDEDHQDDPG